MPRTALARRLEKLERAAREAELRRQKAAGAALLATMSPEHVAIGRAWHTPEVCADWLDHPDDHWDLRARRLDPPSLVRAMYELLHYHLGTGAPLTLPPEVARVYLDDPDAWARDDCEGCGYLAPVRCRRTGRGWLDPLLHYFPRCPLCGGETGRYRYAGCQRAGRRG